MDLNILISGGTGLVGRHLTEKFVSQNDHVYILTRNAKKRENRPNVKHIEYDVAHESMPNIDVVINLAGESLFGYWTKKKKEKILKSRIDTTKKVVSLLERMEPKPKTFISASAIGFYGTDDEKIFTEDTEECGDDFLANVTKKWEAEAKRAENLGIRTIIARFGVILAKDGGALPMMALPMRAFVGGKIGSGKQWTSWIHVDDCVKLIVFAIEQENMIGPLNVTAPHPVRNKQFTEMLGKTLKRPTVFPVPERLLRILFGEMSMLVSKGQYVYPKKALEHGFSFDYPHLNEALEQIFHKN